MRVFGRDCAEHAPPRGPAHKFLWRGGSDRGSYFIPKKITTSEFVYPKKSLLFFLTYPKKSLSSFFATPKKSLRFFFLHNPKNPGIFHRPKKITFDQNFRPKKITLTPPVIKICEWGPWDAPTLLRFCNFIFNHMWLLFGQPSTFKHFKSSAGKGSTITSLLVQNK